MAYELRRIREMIPLTLFMLPQTPLTMRHGLIYPHYLMAMNGI